MFSLGLVHADMFTFKLMYFSIYSINKSFREYARNLFKVSNKNSLRKGEKQNRHSSGVFIIADQAETYTYTKTTKLSKSD